MVFQGNKKNIFNKSESAGRRIMAFFMVLIPVWMTLVFSFSCFYYGSPGFRVDKTQIGLNVSHVGRETARIKPGDIIIRINNVSYPEILSYMLKFEKHLNPDSIGEVLVERDGKKISILPRIEPIYPFQFFSSAWLHLLLIVILLCLGLVPFIRVSSHQPTLLFLLILAMFATTFSATLPSYFGVLAPFTISLSFFTLAVCNWVAFGAYLHFALRFPSQRDLIGNRRWLIWTCYLIAPGISIIGAIVLSDSWMSFWPWMQRLRNVALPFMTLAVFIKHLSDYHALNSTLEKNQLRLIISAFWLSFGPYLVFYAIPNILYNDPIIAFRYVVMFSIILPCAYFIALIRYRLLDVDKLIARTVSYIVVIGLLTVFYSYLVVYLKRTFGSGNIFTEEFILIYVIAIAVLFQPLNSLISMVMDKVFLSEALYRYDMLPQLSRKIGSGIELQRLVKTITVQMVAQINIEQMLLVVFDDKKNRIFPKTHEICNSPVDFNLFKDRFPKGWDYFFCTEISRDDKIASIFQHLITHRIELIFALKGGTGLSGLLLLGRRKDGRPYSRRDIQFFLTIANQTGVVLENGLHYESLVKSKKQVEKMFLKVVQSEKMAALGEMSTILAHELKNPLGIIRSSAQFLAKNTKDTSHQEELLNYIISEVDGLETVINNMMGMARYKSPNLSMIDLEKEIREMKDKWESSGNHNRRIHIKIISQDSLPKIKADFKQLQQVLLNCISNAEDAMPEDGQIEIKLALHSESIVEIAISDTGPGIPEENIDLVFKKFFTTKEKGMGIGLPVCRQIINAHNGTIFLQNKTTGGLLVTIHLYCDPASMPALSDNQDTPTGGFQFVG